MKFVMLALVSWFFGLLSYKANAQEGEKKVTEQINIIKSGDKDVKLTIEFSGDKITINGKPMMEFNEDGIVINNRQIIISDDLDIQGLPPTAFGFSMDPSLSKRGNRMGKSRTYLGVVTEKAEEGVRIKEITKGSPAEKAGLQINDIITKVEDTKLNNSQDLYDAIVKRKAGDEVKIFYKRGKKDKVVRAMLMEKKEEGNMSFTFSGPNGSKVFTIPEPPSPPDSPIPPFPPEELNEWRENFSFPRHQKLGLKIQDTEEGSGVKIINVEENSAAEKAGIKKEDIITEIAGKKINNTDEAREWLQENADSASYTIKAKRNGTEMSFIIKIPKKLKTTNL